MDLGTKKYFPMPDESESVHDGLTQLKRIYDQQSSPASGRKANEKPKKEAVSVADVMGIVNKNFFNFSYVKLKIF